jgi:hypothetical protein
MKLWFEPNLFFSRQWVFVAAAQSRRGYTSIARVLDAVCSRAPKFTHYNLYRSRDLSIS